MLPDLSGFEVLERMGRDRIGGRLPVLFLTARDTLDDKLRGFTLGGDDYMTKPFSVEELIVRVRAILRRVHGDGDDGRLSVSDLRLDEESHEVHRGSTSIELTPTEFKLLHYLMLNSGPGGVQVADPRPGLELRLRRQRQRGRDLHQLPAQEGRLPRPPPDPHRPRRGLLPAPAAGVRPVTLRLRLLLVLVGIVAVGLVVADVATYASLRSYLFSQVDTQLQASGAGDRVGLRWPSRSCARRTVRCRSRPPGLWVQLRDQSGTVIGETNPSFYPLAARPPCPLQLPGSGIPRRAPVAVRRLKRAAVPPTVSYRVLVPSRLRWTAPSSAPAIVAIPLDDLHHTLGRLLLIELLVSVGGARRARRPGLVDRAAQPAPPRRDGRHGRGHRRRGPVSAGRDDRRAHRGRPARQRPQHHAHRDRGRLRGARRLGGAPAALPRRRLARVAHAADVDPRLLPSSSTAAHATGPRTSPPRCATSARRPTA